MHCIRKDGHTIGPQTANDLRDGETQVQEKGDFDVALIFVIMGEVSMKIMLTVLFHLLPLIRQPAKFPFVESLFS